MQKPNSWKTTTSGAALMVSAICQVWLEYSNGQAINWGVVLPQIIGGVGLILAKDANATHSGAGVQPADINQPLRVEQIEEVKRG